MRINPAQALRHPFDDDLAAFLGHVLGEQTADALVQFGGDEVQHLHGAIAIHRAELRQQF